MIQSPTYRGEAFHGEHRNADAHDAIVTVPEWEAANAISGGPGADQGQLGASSQGLIRCAGCRYAMRRTMDQVQARERRDANESRRTHASGSTRAATCPAPAHVMAHTIEPVVIDHFLTWHGLTERTERTADQEDLEAAERALADAEARLEAFLADDELREIVGRDRLHGRRQAPSGCCRPGTQPTVDDARTRAHVDGSRTFILAEEWEDFEHRRQSGPPANRASTRCT